MSYTSSPPTAMSTSGLHIIQITDLHLFAKPHKDLLGVVTEKSFQAVLSTVASLWPLPEVMLLTGDLSQDGSIASYSRLKMFLKDLPIDIYWLAGNHDRLSAMQSELSGNQVYPDKVFCRQGWVFLLLNSLVPGKDSGYLTKETLKDLHKNLQQAADQGQHVLLSLHHPPFPVQSEWLDGSTLQNPEDLFEVLDQFDHVRVVLFGHVHQELHHARGGVEYFACPSTCIQFKPYSQDFHLDEVPPAFREIWLYPDGSFKTQLTRVPEGFQQPNLQMKGY
ncbi:MAG: 3',5'-cyclic-AMP phosphodiesterase [Cyanobacteriota bacterium]|nr:3',5'-cyclic-AMP phosphodiesterase [Cyanobacteriota bacterium]